MKKVIVLLHTKHLPDSSMDAKKVRYPIGIQDFEMIRTRDMLYVDKTALIYDLVEMPAYIFLSRPRRFGKSLLTSTIHNYFAGRKDLFTGLAIEKLEKDWVQYPVLHLDLAPAKRNSAEDLRSKLHDILSEQDKSIQVETSGTPGDRLEKLIKLAYEKTGKPVVLLVDEYDAPVMHVLHNAELLPEIREVMRDLFESLKTCNRFLRFVFITGVSTFSQMGIFSTLNNLKKITDDDKYAAICGITEQELRDHFKQGIDRLAKKMEYSQEKMLAVLKDKYDGYHFSDALVDVYNPFSLLNAFDREKINNYWFDSGISTALVQAFKQYVGDFQEELNLIEDKTWMNQSQFTHSLEDHASIIPLLYQTGYLTIKEYNKKEDLYLLDYPNAEVRVGLLKNLLPLYSSANADAAVNSASRASTALREGNIETAMNNLRSLLKSIPYGKNEPKILQSTEDTEEYYQKFFFLYFRMMYDLVHAEVRNSSGATDVTITTPDYIYVVELKINTAPEIALKQIDEKEYAVPYLEGRRAVYKVGVNFSTETRTISEWKVVEAKGITK
jgi:hypothetical protein